MHKIKAYWWGGAQLQLHLFLTSVLDAGECSASCHARLTSKANSRGINRIEGWIGCRLWRSENCFTPSRMEQRSLDRPPVAQSLTITMSRLRFICETIKESVSTQRRVPKQWGCNRRIRYVYFISFTLCAAGECLLQ